MFIHMTVQVQGTTVTVISRVSKLSKTIPELEFKLDMSLRALEQERSNIDANLTQMAYLNASEQVLQEESSVVESTQSTWK